MMLYINVAKTSLSYLYPVKMKATKSEREKSSAIGRVFNVVNNCRLN